MRVHFSRRTAAITIWRASRFPISDELALDATKSTCEVFPDPNTLATTGAQKGPHRELPMRPFGLLASVSSQRARPYAFSTRTAHTLYSGVADTLSSAAFVSQLALPS